MQTANTTRPFAYLAPWEPAQFTCVYAMEDTGEIVHVRVHHANAYWERVQRNFVCPPRATWQVLEITRAKHISMEDARKHIRECGLQIYEVDPELIGL